MFEVTDAYCKFIYQLSILYYKKGWGLPTPIMDYSVILWKTGTSVILGHLLVHYQSSSEEWRFCPQDFLLFAIWSY